MIAKPPFVHESAYVDDGVELDEGTTVSSEGQEFL